MKEYDIFVSYRRDGGEAFACLISEKLKQRNYSVFYDVESLRSGKFNEKILQVIEACSDVIVVLPSQGLDRCVNDDDWVRKEIAYAIKAGKNIIPIMLRNFEFPPELPYDIQDLRNYNGIVANMEYFDAVFEKLIGMLHAHIKIEEKNLQRYVQDELLNEIRNLQNEVTNTNSPDAKYRLAACYKKNQNPALNIEVYKLAESAALCGHSAAEDLMGLCFEKGIGTERDIKRAFDWYYKSAEQGNLSAYRHIASVLSNRWTGLYFYYIQQAAFQDDANALYSLGLCYEVGTGTSVNYKKAESCFIKARDLGSQKAKKKLGRLQKLKRRFANFIMTGAFHLC